MRTRDRVHIPSRRTLTSRLTVRLTMHCSQYKKRKYGNVMSRKDDSVRCRTRTNSRKVLHCKSLPSERDRSISITKHEKYFRMIPPRKLLLKTVRNFRVVNTTSSKLCFDVAIQAVAYVCRLMTNASVFGDIDAVVSNQ